MQVWIACAADARTADDYRDLLAGAGLEVLRIEHHQIALVRTVRQIDARLELLCITARPRLEEAGRGQRHQNPDLYRGPGRWPVGPGQWWENLVARIWENAVRESLDQIQAGAERATAWLAMSFTLQRATMDQPGH